MMTIGDLLKKRHPEAMEKWDTWDFTVYGPTSLDDEFEITVHLMNRDGSRQVIRLRP